MSSGSHPWTSQTLATGLLPFLHLRDLHLTQVIEAAPDAEAGDPRHSILTACMSDGDKSRKLHFTPAAWLSCLSTSDGVMAFTEGEWQNWFCSFLGVPLPSMLTLIANNRKCPCGRERVKGGFIGIHTCCIHYRPSIGMIQSI